MRQARIRVLLLYCGESLLPPDYLKNFMNEFNENLEKERIYYEEGKEALFQERRGRASKMGTKRPRKNKKTIQENADLLAEVQRLRMENEYLKKLNALVQEREKSEKKIK
mgnify:CR=1 FL=1